MILKNRLVLILFGSILVLAVLTHFIFNLTVFSFLEEHNWVIPSHQKQIALFAFSMLLSMAGMGVFLFVYINRFMAKRIRRLSNSMQQIQGMGDLITRIPEEPEGDEISSLISNFNQMLEKLEHERNTRQGIEKTLITNEKLASVGRLASSMAHEINNPALAISNCLLVVKNKWRSDTGSVQEAVEIAEGEIQRVRAIISSLLDFHRTDESGYAPVDLNDTVRQSIQMLEWTNKLDSSMITIEMQEEFSVHGSLGRLRQVFVNLILNAVDAVDKKSGRILIEIRPASDQHAAEVHIYDNGPGIPPEISETLFEPFISTKNEQGVGLGLYVSQQIIRRHRGQIILDEAYQSGTHFIVTIPVLEEIH
ncbi:MAG: HAMP domain-containing sensor histidine kinase [Candidatus Aminicenantaceae bacterium]